MNHVCIQRVSAESHERTCGETKQELAGEGRPQVNPTIAHDVCYMQPNPASSGYEEKSKEERAQRFPCVEPEIDSHDRKAPSNLLPGPIRRSFGIGDHVEGEQIDPC